MVAAPAEPKPGAWAATSITYRNLATLPTIVRNYEQTYNPTYTNALLIIPQYNLTERLYVRAWQYSNFEITNADDTTHKNEWVLSDTVLTLGGAIYKNKDIGLSLSLGANLALPTSKASQARTLQFGLGIGGGAAWTYKAVSLSFASRATGNVFRSQIGEIEKPWLSSCAGVAQGCDPFVTTGRRNAAATLLNIGSFSWNATERLGFSVGAGMIHSLLYGLPSGVVQTATGPVDISPQSNNANYRVLMYWSLGVDIQLIKGLSLGAGAETYNPQLTLASNYETPFINRYTSIYVDLALSPEKLWQSLK